MAAPINWSGLTMRNTSINTIKAVATGGNIFFQAGFISAYNKQMAATVNT
jgi:hypothetical protein